MADFSKEYCDLYDPGFPHDFSILEIAEALEPEHYTSIICEGFGFLAIGKDQDSNIILAFRDPNEESHDLDIPVMWKKFDEVVVPPTGE